MLIRLIYASQAIDRITTYDISAILGAARRFNAENHITGLLCYGNRRFIQYIEGSRAAIDTLFERIRKDTRHQNMQLLDYSVIEARRYQDWSMGFVSLEDDHIMRALKEKAGMDRFETEDLTTPQALTLLDMLKDCVDPHLVIDSLPGGDTAKTG